MTNNTTALTALQAAKQFIANGIEFGYIRMPDADTRDPAHATPKLIDDAIALLAAPRAAVPVNLLAKPHTGMRVDYTGMFGEAQRALGSRHPACAEMLRQFQGHLTELGQRWYAGDTAVVDELLQLYCVEKDARDALGSAPAATVAEKPAPALILTGAQLLEALDFIAPDRAADQLEAEVSFQHGTGHEGEGMYCWMTEYQDEGAMKIDGSPVAVQDVAAPVAVPAPYLTVYEYDTMHGVHRELYPTTWNGQRPARAIPLFHASAAPVAADGAALDVQRTYHGFVGAHTASTGYAPDERECFDAGVRAGIARAAVSPAPSTKGSHPGCEVCACPASVCQSERAAAPAPADERAAFEAAYAVKWNAAYGNKTSHTAADVAALREGDSYGEDRTHLNAMWEGWEARASQAAAPAEARKTITKERIAVLVAEHYDHGPRSIYAALAGLCSAPADAGEAVAWENAESHTPNDEREVIIFLNGHCALTDMECRKGGGWGIRLGFYDHEKRYWRVHGRPEYFVTHWRELPEAPDGAVLVAARAQGAQGGKGGEA